MKKIIFGILAFVSVPAFADDTQKELNSKWNEIASSFSLGHTPSESDLSIGSNWGCDVISYIDRSKDDSKQFKFELSRMSVQFIKTDHGLAMRTAPADYYFHAIPGSEGLLSNVYGIEFMVLRKRKSSLIIENSSFANGGRTSVMNAGNDATLYIKCKRE